MPETTQNETPDRQLLQQILDGSDQQAFAQLVERYLSLVYGTAMRCLGNPALAEEVAQNVFATLAKKSDTLRKHPSIAGWLQKTAAFQALRAGEKEQTRRKKMREYHSTADVLAGGDSLDLPDEEVVRELDAAILTLPESDRQTILLRFYRQLSFGAIGSLFGKSANTCQKQTSRALDKLQLQLRKRGVTISAVALGTLLGSELARATPQASVASFASSAAANSQAGGAVHSLATSKLALNTSSKPSPRTTRIVIRSAVPSGKCHGPTPQTSEQR